MKARAEQKSKTVVGENLREDYEIGIDRDGKFYVSYAGSCDVCGFSYAYEFETTALKRTK
jgi:hypothetical protein